MARPTKTPKDTVDEDLLISILRIEEQDSATFYQSMISREQAVAADRYFARPYGDGSEVPNRSQVCTRDIQDTINWVMPDLMRPFLAEDAISVDDEGLDDNDEALIDAATLLRHTLMKDNAGAQIIHDLLFDGLQAKYGIIRTAWDKGEPKQPKILEGVTFEQVLKYANDPRYKILAATQDGEVEAEEPDEDAAPQKQLAPPQQQATDPNAGLMAGAGGPPAPGGLMPQQGQPEPHPEQQQQGPEPTFTIQVQRLATGKGRVEIIPPEEFRISRRARSIEESAYHGWQFEDYVAALRKEHPDKKDDLNDENGRFEAALGLDTFYDERLTARFPDELDNGVARIAKEPERRKAVVRIEYIRGDFDGDDVVELRRIKRSGDVILENDIVEESEFTMWSPIRVSHRAIGISLADTLMDIQKIRTALTRRAMDSLSQALAPRLLVSTSATNNDASLIDRLLDHDVGDVIPVSGEPGKQVLPIVTPDVSASAFQAIEYWDRRSEEASGVNRHAMGISPDAITDTKGGIENLQAAANKRIEQYAVWAGIAFETALGKLLRLIIAHQDQPRWIKVNGRRLKMDPRQWSDEMTVSVHVGSVEGRERKMQMLGVIAAKQEQIMMQAGFDNPLCGPKEYRHTLSQLILTSGAKSATPYIKEIPDDWQPPPPQPDPKTQAAMAKLQLEQQKAQADGQLKQAQFQADQQMSQAKLAADTQAANAKAQADEAAAIRDAEHKRQLQAMQIDADAKLAHAKAVAEANLAQQKLETETALARERMAAEMELARWKTAQDVKVKRAAIAAQPRLQMNSGDQKGMNGTGSGVRFGGHVG